MKPSKITQTAQPQKILIIGAGVIGSIYGGKLSGAGHDVTFLARGSRFEYIKNNGINLQHSLTGISERYSVRTVDKIDTLNKYDITLIAVRKNQLKEAAPVIAAVRSDITIFMVNNPLGFDEYITYAGERAVAGFPAAGGGIENGIVKYYIPEGIVKLAQATTFGEIKPVITERLIKLKKIFSDAGFNVEISADMDAWQKTHVALVSPIANAVYKYNNSNYDLAKSTEGVKTMLLAVREGFRVIKKLNLKVTPGKLRMLEYFPLFILTPVFKMLLRTKLAETVITRHALNAKDEMRHLADEFLHLRDISGCKTPEIDKLVFNPEQAIF